MFLFIQLFSVSCVLIYQFCTLVLCAGSRPRSRHDVLTDAVNSFHGGAHGRDSRGDFRHRHVSLPHCEGTLECS